MKLPKIQEKHPEENNQFQIPNWFDTLTKKIYAKHKSYLPLDLTNENVVKANFKYQTRKYAQHQKNEKKCEKYVDEAIKR